MGPILNKEPSNKEIEHNDDNDHNNNNSDISFIPEKVDSPYLKRKRKIPDGGGKDYVNQLNKNISSKIISQLKQELEENEKKAQDLKEEIIKKQKELDDLNEVIKNIKNELDNLEKYKEIKNNLLEHLDSQISNYAKSNESKDVLKNIMNDYWNKNQRNLLPLYQSLNPNSKNNVRTEIKELEKLYQKTYLQTIVIKNKIFENDSSISEEDLNSKNNLKDHKFPNSESINNNIRINNNIIKNFEQYSFKCLTNNLNYEIIKGTKEASFGIELENNGDSPWLENETFLLTDETKSNIKSEKIKLDPLIPNSQKLYDIKFKNIDKFKPGIYKNSLSFLVKGKSYGNNITINLEIL